MYKKSLRISALTVLNYELPDVKNIFDEKRTENVGVNDKIVGVKLNKTQKKIIELMEDDSGITIEEMARCANVETRTIERNIKTLKEKEFIDRIGADKNGHWIVKFKFLKKNLQ